MRYTTRIYDPQVGLSAIGNAIGKFDVNRFLYAIQYKHYEESEIELMAKEVAEYRVKLEQEHIRLMEFAETFNKRFVTENNKCFSTALTLLRKMRSGISEVKRIYYKFCPRWSNRHNPYTITCNKKYSAFDYSIFSRDDFQLSFFGFEGYPPCVQGLYNELSKFFFQLNLSLSLCFKVMQDEERIRKDAGFCVYLLNEFKRKFLDEFYNIVVMIPLDHEDFNPINNPAIASRNSYSSIEAWAPHGFHNYNKPDVEKLIIWEVLKEDANNDITNEEKGLFGANEVFINKVRNIIWHLDELVPEGFNRKKLDSKTIALFMNWCGVKNEGHFVEYFNKQYLNNPNHKYDTVSKSAVNTAKNNLTTTDKDGSLQKQFAKRIDDLHILPSAKQNMAI